MMKYCLRRITQQPTLHSKNNIVVHINEEFSILTGYSKEDLIGKLLIDLNKMIRISSQFNLTNIENKCSCLMFTKDLEPREIMISFKTYECQNVKRYFFKEEPNSRIEDRLQYANSLLLHNEIGVAIYGIPDGIFLKTNKQFLDFWSYESTEIENQISIDTKNTFDGHKGSRFEKILIDLLNTKKSFYFKEAKFKYANKIVRYWDVSIVPVYIAGKPKYIVHTAVDVTLHVLNKELIKEKEELVAVIENMSDEIIIFNKNSEYTSINNAYKENLIFDLTTIKNSKTFFEQVKVYDMNRNLILFENLPSQKVLRGERFSEYKMILETNNGINYKEYSGTPIYDREGNFISGVLVARDISDRLKNQENLVLKSQINVVINMLENLDIGIARYSYPQLKIIDINNKACKVINPKNMSKASHIGKDAFHSFPNEQKNQLRELLKRVLEKKESSYVTTEKLFLGKKERYIKLFIQPLIGFRNEIIEIMITFVDISEDVNAKNKIEEALKLQDEIFANVTHELKTPLNVIFTANQLMELYLSEDSLESNKETFVRNNQIIKQNCYRQIKLINNIVDLINIESGYFKFNPRNENIVDTVETLVQSVSKFIKGKELRIIFDTDIEEKIMAYDIEKIERIILNLISNAIKFSNSGGEILVDIVDKDESVEISVKDMGIGIDKTQVNSIFEKFYQVDKTLNRKSEGNGIGLYLVKSLIEMHGGKISVESEVGVGSIFRIELPTRVQEVKGNQQNLSTINKIEMINIELSDIYTL